MNAIIKRLSILSLTLAVSATAAFSAGYNLEKSTPVGSWQLRQEIMQDSDGRPQYAEVKTSMVGEEERDGIDYVWVEMVRDSFRYKNGQKGKKAGDTVIVKILLEASLLKGNPEDVFNNMRGLGKEIIMQSGDADPMKIEEGGMLGGAIMDTLGMEIDYNFEETGKEKVETAAGKIKCKVIEGTGSVKTKIIFKTIVIDGTSKQWMSDEVPFGIVKAESTSTMNGETSTTSSLLLDYGKKGATSQIQGEAQSLQIPGLKGLFGG